MINPVAPNPPKLPDLWDPEADNQLVCVGIIQETSDVKSFIFQSLHSCLFAFLPGQYLTFEFYINGETLYRCYTISSAPTRPFRINISVKRVANGPVSNWLHDQLKPGDVVRASPPMGEFSYSLYRSKKYLFLSAGSGITPLMSMARHSFDLCEKADIVFVHSARSPDDLIFADELRMLSRRQSQFRTAFIVESEPLGTAWHGFRGRLDAEILRNICPDISQREILCCGPSPYMSGVKAMLQHLSGFDMRHYHEESFRFESLGELADRGESIAKSAQTYRVTFAKSGRTVECDANTNLLVAGKASGIILPSSCTRGMCGTCKSKKIAGEVTMTHAGGIRQREIDAGLILLCCSKPSSDVTIDR